MPKLPRNRKGWHSADVYWYCPGRKRPIAYSTMATSGIIRDLSRDGCTISELRKKILFGEEIQTVLDEYIKRGFGDLVAKEYFG